MLLIHRAFRYICGRPRFDSPVTAHMLYVNAEASRVVNALGIPDFALSGQEMHATHPDHFSASVNSLFDDMMKEAVSAQ